MTDVQPARRLAGVKPERKFLTRGRSSWLAKFFQNATIVLLAGIVGGDVFLKASLVWKIVLVAGVVIGFSLGLVFAPPKDDEGGE